jgi:hypothetical protein
MTTKHIVAIFLGTPAETVRFWAELARRVEPNA